MPVHAILKNSGKFQENRAPLLQTACVAGKMHLKWLHFSVLIALLLSGMIKPHSGIAKDIIEIYL